MKRTTLGELGMQLPIGTPKGKKFDKGFALRPYKSIIDRHLGNWKEANAKKYPGSLIVAAQIPKFVSLICTEFGGKAYPQTKDFDSTPDQELSLYQAFHADVMYAYIMARVAISPDLELNPTCPGCGKSFKIVFDLNTLDVDILEDGDALEKVIELKHPFKLRDGKLCKAVKVRPIQWAAMMQPGVFSGQMDQVSYSALTGCICGVDCIEGPYTMIESEVDEIHRIDSMRISAVAGTQAAGVDLETNVTCPHEDCGVTITNPLNWTHDYFFGSSFPMSETVIS